MNVLMCQGTPREVGAGARAQEHARCHPGSMSSTAAQVQPVCVPPASPCKDRGGDSARFCAHWGLREARSPHKVPAPRKVRHQGSPHGDPSGLAGPCPHDRSETGWVTTSKAHSSRVSAGAQSPAWLVSGPAHTTQPRHSTDTQLGCTDMRPRGPSWDKLRNKGHQTTECFTNTGSHPPRWNLTAHQQHLFLSTRNRRPSDCNTHKDEDRHDDFRPH